jgi:hypothetical protein
MDTLTRLMNEDLPPDEARAIVQAIPGAAGLIPELKREDLRDKRSTGNFESGDPEATWPSDGIAPARSTRAQLRRDRR